MESKPTYSVCWLEPRSHLCAKRAGGLQLASRLQRRHHGKAAIRLQCSWQAVQSFVASVNTRPA